MFRYSVVAVLAALLVALPAAAETRIGVVDLRQALFSSSDARAFSETLQKDFAGEEAKVREAQDAARKLKEQQFLEEARPEVDAAVKELLEENNLDMILPSEAVVYVKPEMNLTAELLEKLDR